MTASRSNARRRRTRRLLAVLTFGVAAVLAASPPASAATTATFANGVLTVTGDAANNSIVISRNAAGKLLVNNGAVAVVGGSPTVANTSLVRAFGLAGNDSLSLDETNGALPRANLFGGGNNDTLVGGSSNDQLFGQSGNDTLQGRGGFDVLTGGTQNDTLTGGDADDQAFGQGGTDRMIWNPGDDTDLNEGGAGTDTVEVNGGGGGEQFTTTANGLRVRFDRLNPAPFAIDIGTSEKLVLNANGGNDSHSATGNLAALIAITVDGGAGGDTILGSNGIDLLLGGDNDDFVDGQQGNDVAFLGAGTDVFQWDPGDGSDTVEGQDGSDTMLFNGSGANEGIDIAANGGRVLFFRDIAAVTMDLDDVETVDFNALGGADTIVVNDLSGTDVTDVTTDLAFSGSGDAQADNVVVQGTNGDDVALVEGNASGVSVLGLAARVNIVGAEAANDRLTVNQLAGDDVVDASGLAVGSIQLTADGGNDDDVLIGGDGNDILLGGFGDDVLIGGPGLDVIDGGDGDDIEIQLVGEDAVTSAKSVGEEWVSSHFRVVEGDTVLDVGGETRELPRLDLSQLT
jgi:Ca2+-binding RTX toxin-like protein